MQNLLAPILTRVNEASPLRDRLKVGFETNDDAAVIAGGSEDFALTVDVLTPLVDDPYQFGRIAAANALSDVYAMGGRPLVALNVLGLDCHLGADVARAVLEGGADAVAEAGALVAGGHSVDDPEPKYGLCVLGAVQPDRAWRNNAARAGDELYLTKPLGTGIMSSAFKVAEIDETAYQPAIASMMELNAAAAEALADVSAPAVTDVTGYGLAGHLLEMLEASSVAAQLDWEALPMFDGVLELARAYCRPSRSFEIMDFVEGKIVQGDLNDDAFDDRMAILCDPQTSGGLLAALRPEEAPRFVQRFTQLTGRAPARIGRIIAADRPLITFSDANS